MSSCLNMHLDKLCDLFICQLKTRGNKEVSIENYRCCCKLFQNFAKSVEEQTFTPSLEQKYKAYLEQRLNSKEICYEYRRFLLRILRMLSSLAKSGKIDFSFAKNRPDKYPVSPEIGEIIENIFVLNSLSEKIKRDLIAPMKHFFWYANERSLDPSSVDDTYVMKFLIEEAPKTNQGSLGRTLRTVKLITNYLKSKGNTKIKRDYNHIKLKEGKRRMIQSFSEKEIKEIANAVNTETSTGKRDYAIILLAFCTGLRGIDIVNLKFSNINWHDHNISLIQSKTNKQIIAELNGITMNAIADYILHARPKCDVQEIFVRSKAPYRKLSGSLYILLRKYCDKVGITHMPFRGFHSLRRAFETVMLSNGVDIEIASQMMGHKSIEEDKPYITHNKSQIAFVAMDFTDVPLTSGFYSKQEVKNDF